MGKRTSVYKNPAVIAIGKTARVLARLRGGGGSALPGLVVEKIAPDFAPKVLGALPYGVVVVSGTNGKTTTTKIVTELLEKMGLKVLTNDTGSNFMRGVIAALLLKMTLGGRLDADIAVLELDEAHAVHFAKKVPPRFSLLLNVMPDQLDRFGSVEYTAGLLAQVACHTTGLVVANREDPLLAALAETAPPLQARLRWFGLSPQLLGSFSLQGSHSSEKPLSASVVLDAVQGSHASFEIDGAAYSAELSLKGIYNAYNAAAALALVREVLGEGDQQRDEQGNLQPAEQGSRKPDQQQDEQGNLQPAEQGSLKPDQQRDEQGSRKPDQQLDYQLIEALAKVQGAFGRGESFIVDGREVEMVLVKNSGGFQLALGSFDPQGYITMTVTNDEVGDGRDISWLFDVDFSSLQKTGVTMVSGSRAYEMALRLGYDDVPFKQVEADPVVALKHLLADATAGDMPLRIYCCYTGMTRLHAHLSALAGGKQVAR